MKLLLLDTEAFSPLDTAGMLQGESDAARDDLANSVTLHCLFTSTCGLANAVLPAFVQCSWPLVASSFLTTKVTKKKTKTIFCSGLT